MTTKTLTKNSKKVIIDYSDNSGLDSVFNFLEAYYQGMTKAEITKMALVNLLRSNNLPIHQMTDDEEAEYSKAMEDKTVVKTLKSKKDISDYIMSM